MDLGHWKLDDDAKDYSRWANDGIVNGVLFDSKPLFAGGKTSAYFNGSSSISIPAAEELSPMSSDFFIEFFILRESDNFTVLAKPGAYNVSYNQTLSLSMTGSKGSQELGSGVELNQDSNHVIISYRAATGDASFFVNGKLADNSAGGHIGVVESANNLSMGSNFVGELDNVIVGLGVVTERQARERFNAHRNKADYETFVVFNKPYAFIPLGEFIDDSSGSGRAVTWSAEPVETDPIIYGMQGASDISTETLSISAPTLPFSVTLWFNFSSGLKIFSYGDTELRCTATAVEVSVGAATASSATMREGQIVMATVNYTGSTDAIVNGEALASIAGASSGPNVSFFGQGATKASSIELGESLSAEQHEQRYSIGFTGRANKLFAGGQFFASVVQSEKVLNFEWNNYSVKQ